jgi:hypothetical protein
VDKNDQVGSNCESVDRPAPPIQTFVIAAAGDIASGNSGDDETAAVLDKIAPNVVLSLGDNAYPDGALSEFQTFYEPTWRHRHAPAEPGNHDYHTEGASGYFVYFGPGPGSTTLRPAVHLISLTRRSRWRAQAAGGWDDLASSTSVAVAYWHKPRFTAEVRRLHVRLRSGGCLRGEG